MGPMNVKGTFEVTMQGEPPYEDVGGVSFSRARFEKKFSGPLTATSTVQMLAARSAATPTSAGYVALERISGTLDGKRGSFAAMHLGVSDRGAQSLTITLVPDSGTGELVGISGTMKIEVVKEQHAYELDYDLE